MSGKVIYLADVRAAAAAEELAFDRWIIDHTGPDGVIEIDIDGVIPPDMPLPRYRTIEEHDSV